MALEQGNMCHERNSSFVRYSYSYRGCYQTSRHGFSYRHHYTEKWCNRKNRIVNVMNPILRSIFLLDISALLAYCESPSYLACFNATWLLPLWNLQKSPYLQINIVSESRIWNYPLRREGTRISEYKKRWRIIKWTFHIGSVIIYSVKEHTYYKLK